jgi:integrase
VGRKATGTVRILNGEDGKPAWHGRWTRADGTRSDWLPLPGVIALDDEAGAKACAARMAPRIRARSANNGQGETVEQYSKRWLDDRDGRVHSIRDDRSRMRDHVLPTLGHLGAATFTRDDVEQLRDLLDTKITKGTLAWKTAASVWTLVTSMCSDMVDAKKRELRARQDNPCRDVRPPERGARKAKQYLYPSEFLQFVSCTDVPLSWRRAVAIAVYSYTRDAELRVLRWSDIDHGIIDITRAYNRRQPGEAKGTKSDAPRRFALEAELLPLLEVMRGEGGTGLVIDLPSERDMSRGLRRWLLKAGVRRAALHERSKTSQRITWHDLRATGITWCAVRGDDTAKIKGRAGHTSVLTTELYVREAEAVRGGFGEPFPPLPAGLLRIAPKSPRAISVSRSSLKQAVLSGADGTRTRGLRRDRPAL